MSRPDDPFRFADLPDDIKVLVWDELLDCQREMLKRKGQMSLTSFHVARTEYLVVSREFKKRFTERMKLWRVLRIDEHLGDSDNAISADQMTSAIAYITENLADTRWLEARVAVVIDNYYGRPGSWDGPGSGERIQETIRHEVQQHSQWLHRLVAGLPHLRAVEVDLDLVIFAFHEEEFTCQHALLGESEVINFLPKLKTFRVHVREDAAEAYPVRCYGDPSWLEYDDEGVSLSYHRYDGPKQLWMQWSAKATKLEVVGKVEFPRQDYAE